MSNQKLEPVVIKKKNEAGDEVEIREPLLFLNPSNGVYFLRKRAGKVDTTVSLRTTRLTAARQLREDYWAAIRAQKLGLVPTPPAPTEAPAPPRSQAAGITPVLPAASPALATRPETVDMQKDPDEVSEPKQFETMGEVIRYYQKRDYATEDGEPRKKNNRADEERHCRFMLPFWDNIRLDKTNKPKMVEYKKWRCKDENHKQGTGLRAVDRDLNTANNACKLACMEGRIQSNPFIDRPRFRKHKDVKHCREFMPEDADELHDAAEILFRHVHSVVLGFLLLIEAYTGLRGEEPLHWGEEDFGELTESGKDIRVWRVKDQHLVNPYCEYHPALEATLEAFKAWKKVHYPKAKKFWPSHCGGQIYKGSLAQALLRIRPLLKRPLKPHGAGRAFFVLVWRSWGKNDEEIAHMLGQESGGGTIKSVYGGVPRNWGTTLPKLSWLPTKRKPAWEVLPECAGITRKFLQKAKIAKSAKPTAA